MCAFATDRTKEKNMRERRGEMTDINSQCDIQDGS